MYSLSSDSDLSSMQTPTKISGKPVQTSSQHSEKSQIFFPSSDPVTEFHSTEDKGPKTVNDSEVQHFLGTVRPPRYEKSSISIHQRHSRDSDDSYELEDNGSLYWWKPIVLMASWILLGVLVGLGHHFAYQKLDRQPQSVFSQKWAHNLGSGAAFLVKTSFTLTVLISLKEVLWFSFRERAIKISLLDKLFTLSSNPLSFVPSAFVNAPLATGLAAFAWIIPISAIVSPGSLVVGPLVTFNSSTCVVPTFAASSPQISFYQMVPHSSTIQGPNTGIKKLASQIFAQGTILKSTSPCGTNCSFEHSFDGPALQCKIISNPSYINEQVAGWLYYNATDLTTFTQDGHSPMEMIITYRNNTKSQSEFKPRTNYSSISCVPRNSTYHLSVNYTNDEPKFSTRLVYHTQLRTLNISESVNPEISPWLSNSATLVREVYENHLSGTWQMAPTTQYASSSTLIGNTILVGDTVSANSGATSSLWFVNQDLLTGIPELLTNLTISTLAFSPMNTTTTCFSSTEILAYHYTPSQLLIPYSIALLLSLISFAAGVFVLKKTGIRTGEVFSQILVATRNPFLDDIARGHSLSSADAVVMKDYKLKLGRLTNLHDEYSNDYTGVEVKRTGHAAFGLAEQVERLH